MTSDHFDGRRFFNPSDTYEERTLKHIVKWQMNAKRVPWSPPAPVKQTKPEARVDGLRVTMVNHATLLVQQGGVNVLTDPVYSERVSPFSWAGPMRHTQPGIAFADLPKIDVVLVSHDHYDHCDIDTLRRLHAAHAPKVITGLAMAPIIREAGITDIVELDWWQSTKAGVDVAFLPAQHWSSRSPFSRNTRLWGSFLLTSAEQVFYFAADTGYGPHFKRIHERYPRIDLAALPIGAYEPRWFMKPQHMNPDDAVIAHLELEAQRSIGIHWGTFKLTEEDIEHPVQHLEEALAKHGAKNFSPIRNGESAEP